MTVNNGDWYNEKMTLVFYNKFQQSYFTINKENSFFLLKKGISGLHTERLGAQPSL